jgi:peptidoglycan hydrolase CwlO-like protein
MVSDRAPSPRRTRRAFGSRRGALAVAAALTTVGALGAAPVSRGDLSSRADSLRRIITAESGRINGYRGRVHDLEVRLAGLESSLATQRALLLNIQDQLTAAENRLVQLRTDLARDRKALAAQLVSQYESPSPDVVGVVLQANSFSDLLAQVEQMRLIANNNARVLGQVARDKADVARQAASLAVAQARQQRVTAAVLIERDQVASLKLSMLEREQYLVRDRAHRRAELKKARHQLAVLAARAAAAQRAAFGIALTGGVSASGAWGFFPAPGTNYRVGQEPVLAARLNRLGKALGLHLIGLSGYRTPQHSVEVGGFANDPHTRGLASDTPGIEGVPEATLLKFGLTRPFPGPAEADHIQLS